MAKLLKYLFLPLVAAALIFIISAASKKSVAGNKLNTIVIDAGHGGHDPGTHGGSTLEKDVALKIALKLGQIIKDSLPDVKLIYTRKTDIFIPLSERSNIANKNNADLFISIHCNANNNTSARGTETFIMGLHKTAGNLNVSKRENAAILLEEDYEDNKAYGGFDPNSPIGHIIFSMLQNAYLDQSASLAGKIESEFKDSTSMKSRGVKQAGFLVLWKTTMPSVLVETGFLTNPNNRKILKSDTGQTRIAQSVFRAVQKRREEIAKENAKKESDK